MSNCYRTGGCGPYENRACNECPASRPEYQLKNWGINIYVAVLNGEIKDNYMTIGLSSEAAVEQIIKAYFGKDGCTEEELNNQGIYINITPFENGKTMNVS